MNKHLPKLAVAGALLLGAIALSLLHPWQEPSPEPNPAPEVNLTKLRPEALGGAETQTEVPPRGRRLAAAAQGSGSSEAVGQTETGLEPGALPESRKTLSAAECQRLYSLLMEPLNEQRIHPEAALRNDILGRLMGQPHLPADYDRMLSELVGDPAVHPVVRDYALQHLFEWYEALKGAATEGSDPAALERMLPVFWRATAQPENPTAGTALLGLLHLAEVEAAIDRGRIADAASALARNDQADALARTTALQVGATLNAPDLLETARQIAQAEGAIPLRAAAIALIGERGSPQDAALLNSLQKLDGGALRRSIAAALGSLTKSKKA